MPHNRSFTLSNLYSHFPAGQKRSFTKGEYKAKRNPLERVSKYLRPLNPASLILWIRELSALRLAGFLVNPAERIVDFTPPAFLDEIGVTH